LRLSVPAEARGERLDRFLATAQTDLSRSRLQLLIRDGFVRVNGAPGRASLRLRLDDAVELELPERVADARLEPEPIPLDLVYEDDALLVIDKPAGLVVHPGAGVSRGTLVSGLLHHVPEIATVGGTGRPGIVHRLDRDTTGLMVVAKQDRAWRALVAAIQAREVSRMYLALVWGDPREHEGVIETAFGRDPRDRRRMAVVRTGGKSARTRWRVIERFGLATLLEVRLDTGRTHQIRVHLAHLGHPVVGDPTYGGRGKKQLRLSDSQRSLATALLVCMTRQALHACELGFSHPVTGEDLRFSRPVPGDFARALDLLRSRSPSRSTVSRT
jgi:23S rRNA pseudouridine1911/1915/1917 synthase